MSPQTYPYTVDIQTFSEKVFGPPKADSEEVFECRGIVILICGSTRTYLDVSYGLGDGYMILITFFLDQKNQIAYLYII